MSKEIPAHILLKLSMLKNSNPQRVFHELRIGHGTVLRVVGDPDNGGYEWVIESAGSELEFSDCAYGQSAVALCDGLIAIFGTPTPSTGVGFLVKERSRNDLNNVEL